jgi:hypothetical protein
VLAVTAAGIATAMTFRPAFRHQVQDVLGLAQVPPVSAGSFYRVRVAPLFQARCAGCHGVQIDRGRFRLDSFARLMRGGKHGAMVVPGAPDHSELFRRITLPQSDAQAMPPSGKSPLTPDDITVIRLWIAAGASGTLPVQAIADAPRPVVEVEIPDSDPARVAKARAQLADRVRVLQARFPGMITYMARDSADLEVNAARAGRAFGNAQLAALLPLKDRIVRADLSGTGITDGAAPILASMSRLEVLRLADTKIGAAALAALAPLKALRSVTVPAMPVAASMPLRQRGVAIYGGGDGH